MKRKEEMKNRKNDSESGKGGRNEGYIKVANIHFNYPSLFTFKSDSFSCNLVINYNLFRKLIPN